MNAVIKIYIIFAVLLAVFSFIVCLVEMIRDHDLDILALFIVTLGMGIFGPFLVVLGIIDRIQDAINNRNK